MTDITIKLWRNNRLDGEWDISSDELIAGFIASGWAADTAMADYYGSEMRLIDYIGNGNGGLSSALVLRSTANRKHDVVSCDSPTWDALVARAYNAIRERDAREHGGAA